MRAITHLVVHHSATAGTTTKLSGIDNFHRTKNWGTAARPAYAKISRLGYYVQYHYFIDWRGVLTQTRGDDEIGWHANAANSFSLGICLAGWFDPGHDRLPSPDETAMLKRWLARLAARYKIPPKNIIPHRIFNPRKTCYGSNLADNWARNLILNHRPR